MKLLDFIMRGIQLYIIWDIKSGVVKEVKDIKKQLKQHPKKQRLNSHCDNKNNII